MADENRLRCSDLLQEILQSAGEGGNTDGWERRRAAIARHVPGDGAIAVLEKIELSAPRPCRAADAMQEHQRRRSGIAGGLITETAIPGFHGRQLRHAGPPDKANLPMLTGLQAMKSNNFILKQAAFGVCLLISGTAKTTGTAAFLAKA